MRSRDILIYLSIDNDGDWDKIYADIVAKRKDFKSDDAEQIANSLTCKTLTIVDPEYPDYLKKCYKPPFVIFYYGDISLIGNYLNNIAVIGSRECSNYGANMTATLTKDIAKDFIIVSGLAKGIDSIAHATALDSGGRTVAVLGSGIDNCYPSESLSLYQKIKQNHLLLSEYPGTVSPDSAHFPMRNRLIAAFSRGIVVTDAAYKSGTSITVGHALELGRSICCVPHLATEHSLCNKLISDGAKLAETTQDIYDEINFQPTPRELA